MKPSLEETAEGWLRYRAPEHEFRVHQGTELLYIHHRVFCLGIFFFTETGSVSLCISLCLCSVRLCEAKHHHSHMGCKSCSLSLTTAKIKLHQSRTDRSPLQAANTHLHCGGAGLGGVPVPLRVFGSRTHTAFRDAHERWTVAPQGVSQTPCLSPTGKHPPHELARENPERDSTQGGSCLLTDPPQRPQGHCPSRRFTPTEPNAGTADLDSANSPVFLNISTPAACALCACAPAPDSRLPSAPGLGTAAGALLGVQRRSPTEPLPGKGPSYFCM